MLRLWLSPEYRGEKWNISDKINDLADLFRCLRLPSTTTRLPRSLMDYNKLKANELRVLLLFGYVIFNRQLPKKIYDHLVQLVV